MKLAYYFTHFTLGKDSVDVPSFVPTFCAPSISLAMPRLAVANTLAALVGGTVLSTAFPPLLLDQLFVVGMGSH